MKKIGIWIAIFWAGSAWGAPIWEAPPGTQLAEPELIALCQDALAGNAAAVKRVREELAWYESQLVAGEPLNDFEEGAVNLMNETLDLVMLPPSVHPLYRDVPSTVRELPSIDSRSDAYRLRTLFSRRHTLIYSGYRKDYLTSRWKPSGRTMKWTIYRVAPLDRDVLEVSALREIVMDADKSPSEQLLATFIVSRAGVFRTREVVYNRPAPQVWAVTGPLDPEWLIRTPIIEGKSTEGFVVRAATHSIATMVGSSTGALTIADAVEKLTLAPGLGIVELETFDERWTVRERRDLPEIAPAVLSSDEMKLLLRAVKSWHQRNGMRVERILEWGSDANAPSGFGPLRENESIPPRSVVLRALAWRREKTANEQKLYRISDQRWTRQAGAWVMESATDATEAGKK